MSARYVAPVMFNNSSNCTHDTTGSNSTQNVGTNFRSALFPPGWRFRICRTLSDAEKGIFRRQIRSRSSLFFGFFFCLDILVARPVKMALLHQKHPSYLPSFRQVLCGLAFERSVDRIAAKFVSLVCRFARSRVRLDSSDESPVPAILSVFGKFLGHLCDISTVFFAALVRPPPVPVLLHLGAVKFFEAPRAQPRSKR